MSDINNLLDVAHSASILQDDQFPKDSRQKKFYEHVNFQTAPVFTTQIHFNFIQT